MLEELSLVRRTGRPAFAHTTRAVGDYVLVSTTARVVEVYSRRPEAWELRIYHEHATVELPSIDVRIAVDALYRGVELDPARPRAAQPPGR